MDIGELKGLISDEIDSRRRELGELSRNLHDTPELAFEEHRAAVWLAGYLEANGFSMERGICALPTAFRGTYGSGAPSIAILAEYDALPKLGHACGHNLIATCSVAAGVAARKAVDSLGGSVVVIGTPGEEIGGGKVIMAERGAFDGLDMAMIVHPGGGNTVAMKTLTCQTLSVSFSGRAAHAAARPEEGINALEAMLLAYNAINSLRQHVRDDARIHGIITDGGEAANIVPAHTAASFIVRAGDDSYLDELKERVIGCFTGAAEATGAKLEYQWRERYAAMLNNMTMARLFQRNMRSLGHRMRLSDPHVWGGSSDVGNVSQLVPAIQPFVGIAPDGVLVHSPEFAEAAGSEAGLARMLDAARALAMTAADLLNSPGTAEKVREEFRRGG
jgi:amidohydrolase